MTTETLAADPILGFADACEVLDLSAPTVRELIYSGALPAARVGRGRGQWRIRKSWIDLYLDRAAAAAAPNP